MSRDAPAQLKASHGVKRIVTPLPHTPLQPVSAPLAIMSSPHQQQQNSLVALAATHRTYAQVTASPPTTPRRTPGTSVSTPPQPAGNKSGLVTRPAVTNPPTPLSTYAGKELTAAEGEAGVYGLDHTMSQAGAVDGGRNNHGVDHQVRVTQQLWPATTPSKVGIVSEALQSSESPPMLKAPWTSAGNAVMRPTHALPRTGAHGGRAETGGRFLDSHANLPTGPHPPSSHIQVLPMQEMDWTTTMADELPAGHPFNQTEPAAWRQTADSGREEMTVHDQPEPAEPIPFHLQARTQLVQDPFIVRLPEGPPRLVQNTPLTLQSPAKVYERPVPRDAPTTSRLEWPPTTPRLAPVKVARPPTPFTLALPARPISGAKPLVFPSGEERWASHIPPSSNLAHPSLTGYTPSPPQLNVSDFVFTPPPPGGFPSISFWDRDSLVQGLPPLRVAAIDKPTCKAVLIQVWNVSRQRTAETATIRAALTAAIQIGAGAGKFSLIAPEPAWTAPGVPATDTPTWTGLNLSDEVIQRLVTMGVWSSKAITFFAYPSKRTIPRFLFLLNGFTGNYYDNDLSQAISNAFQSDASLVHLRPMFAEHPDYSLMTTAEAMQALLQTVRVSMQELTSGNLVTALYCDPPTEDIHRWRAWRHTLTLMTYPTPFCGTGTFRQQSPCLGCHGSDHLTHLCPYPTLPGWNGPPAGNSEDHGMQPPPPRPEPSSSARIVASPDNGIVDDAMYGRSRGGHSRGRGGLRRGQRTEKTRFAQYANPY
ncbi:hypothetical protein ACG7TL_005560 [Trametes sanguinea]